MSNWYPQWLVEALKPGFENPEDRPKPTPRPPNKCKDGAVCAYEYEGKLFRTMRERDRYKEKERLKALKEKKMEWLIKELPKFMHDGYDSYGTHIQNRHLNKTKLLKWLEDQGFIKY